MKTKQKGFTLIEIGIVLFVIGILVAVFLPSFTGGIKDSGKSTALYSGAQKVAGAWVSIAKECSVSTAIAGNPLPLSTNSVLDVVGDSNLANLSYTTCIKNSNTRSMGDLVGPATGHKIEGYPVALVDAPNGYVAGKICSVFTAVPDSIVLGVVKAHGSGVAVLSADDLTNSNVQYGVATGGARDLTICVDP